MNAVAEPLKFQKQASLIRLRAKNQITLPQEAVDSLGLGELGMMTYTVLQDGVLIKPAIGSVESKLEKIRRIGRNTASVYKDEADVDAYIRALRDEWES